MMNIVLLFLLEVPSLSLDSKGYWESRTESSACVYISYMSSLKAAEFHQMPYQVPKPRNEWRTFYSYLISSKWKRKNVDNFLRLVSMQQLSIILSVVSFSDIPFILSSQFTTTSKAQMFWIHLEDPILFTHHLLDIIISCFPYVLRKWCCFFVWVWHEITTLQTSSSVQLRCCFPVRCYSSCMAGMGSSGWSVQKHQKKHNQEDTSKEIYRHLINNNRIMCCIKNYIWLGIWRGIVVSWHFHGFELYHNVWVKFIPLPCNLSRMAIAHWPQGSFESSRRVIVSEGHEPHPARRFPQGQQKHNANYPVNGRNPYVWNIDVNYFVSKLGMTSFQCKICSQNLKAKNFFFFFFGIRSGWKSKAPHEVDWNWNPM